MLHQGIQRRPILRALRQQPPDELLRGGTDLLKPLVDRGRGVGGHDLGRELDQALAVEGHRPAEELERDHAQGPDVAGRVLLALALLGRQLHELLAAGVLPGLLRQPLLQHLRCDEGHHVARDLLQGVGLHQVYEPEVRDHDRSTRVHEDVLGPQRPVDQRDARAGAHFQRAHQLPGDLGGPLLADVPGPGDALVQRQGGCLLVDQVDAPRLVEAL
mmetsp:Transcript_95252/g.269095  ORF Transcript_95252/g.269095 Transcript_95252/m.269095 type:complete len:216 (-) Transcript_95252:401-1048(-)